MAKSILIVLLLALSVFMAHAGENELPEITVEHAIQIASNAAKNSDFNTTNTRIEILKFKEGREKGPLRMVWLFRSYPKEISDKLINSDFWVIYFYPKEKFILGGDYTTFIDLYSGELLESFTGQ